MERLLIRTQDLLQGIPAEVSDSQIGEGYTAVVLSADAQATIAALQAKVSELQGIADEKCRCFLERAEQSEKQLTQRTAELEAATRERYHAKKMEAVQKEVADNQTWHVQQLRAELERVRAALERIARYGNDGICPFGCDTPYIAQEALGQHRQGMEG